MKENKIAVLIPCYNESKTIKKVVSDYKKVLPEADIYVYDNNSSDGTDKIASESGAIVRYERKQGKGNVIRSMFQDIENDGIDMVIGDRLSSTYFQENKRPFHNMGNKLVRNLIEIMFKTNIKDIMTGYRAFSYKFVKTFPVLSKGFEIETEMSIHAVDKNFTLKEIPVMYRDRPEGSVSKLNTYKDGLKVLKTIGTLFKEYKPALFFNIIALIVFIISIILAVPVFSEYFRTGLVPRIPTLVVSGILFIVGLLLETTGLILQVTVKKNRQAFEISLNQICILKNNIMGR